MTLTRQDDVSHIPCATTGVKLAPLLCKVSCTGNQNRLTVGYKLFGGVHAVLLLNTTYVRAALCMECRTSPIFSGNGLTSQLS